MSNALRNSTIFSSSFYEDYFRFWNDFKTSFPKTYTFAQKRRTFGGSANQDERASHVLHLDQKVTDCVLTTVQGSEEGLFVVALTAFTTLIRKYTGDREIVVASPVYVSDSGSGEIYADTVPMLITVPDDASIAQMLSDNRSAVHDFYEFQNFPLNLIDEYGDGYYTTNVSIRSHTMHGDHAAGLYDLSVEVTHEGRKIELNFDYKRSVFDDYFILNFSFHLEAVFRAFTDVNRKISDIRILTELERDKLVNGYNPALGQPADLPSHIQQFESQASRTPDAPALSYRDQALSYDKLNALSNQLAHHLVKDLNLVRDEPVAILMERSHWMVISMLAIAKAGGAFMPIDISNPDQRRKQLLDESGTRVLITDSEHMFSVSYYTKSMVVADIQISDVAADTGNLSLSPSNLAYIMFTSGSTGKPQGVKVSIRNFTNYITWANSYYFENETGFSFPFFTSPSFDLTLTSIFSPLLRGDKLVVYADGPIDAILKKVCEDGEAGAIKLTPSHIQILRMLGFSSLKFKVVIAGGEELMEDHISYLHSANRQMKIYNEYGPTEATVGCTVKEVSRDKGKISIGKPIANAQIYIASKDLELAPEGMEGEILIGGECVTSGYLDKDTERKGKFIPNPFNRSDRNAVLYRTGDLGRWLSDGNIEYTGRMDEQIKNNGHRIEPNEIVSEVRSIEGVEDACLLASDSFGSNEKKITMFVVPDKRSAYTVSKFLGIIREKPSLKGKSTTLQNGLLVFYLNKSELAQTYEEVFEDNIYSNFGIEVREGDTLIDVGANIGMFSLYMGLKVKDVKIFAFEPATPVYNILESNLSLYDINAKTFNFGISSKAGKDTFYYYPNNSVLSGRYGSLDEERHSVGTYLHNKHQAANSLKDDEIDQVLESRVEHQLIKCDFRTLSQVIEDNKLTRIDLLKIDVEKSEWDVLTGIKDDHWQIIQQIIIEVHDIGDNLSRIKDTLTGRGFTIVTEQEEFLKGTNIYNIYASKLKAVVEGVKESALVISRRHLINQQDFVSFIKESLRQKLPSYMIPADFHFIETIPVTQTGKIDKAALLKIDEESQAEKAKYEAPSDTLEASLVGIWEDVLAKNGIGVNDNFFELGGHSLNAIKIASYVHREFGVQVDLEYVFQHPTIREFARHLKTELKSTFVPIAAIEQQLYYRATFSQTKLWLACQGIDTPSLYFITEAYKIGGKLEVTILEQAFKAVMARHESLRTVFFMTQGVLMQKVKSPFDTGFAMQYQELDESLFDADTIIDSVKRSFLNEEMDLSKDCLLAVKVIRLGDLKHLVLIKIHHIVADGWSIEIFRKELTEQYNALKSDREVFVPLQLQFKDFSAYLNKRLRNGDIDRMGLYWREQFARPLPALNLKKDFPNANGSHQGSSRSFAIDHELYLNLLTLAKRNQATVFMVLLSGLKILLYKQGGVRDVITGIPMTGRDHADLENQIGLYINTVPLRVIIGKDDDFLAVLETVRNRMLEASDNQFYPLELLLDDLNLPFRHTEHPLFDVLAQYMEGAEGSSTREFNALTVDGVDARRSLNKFGLTVDFWGYRDRSVVRVGYKIGAFSESTIEDLMNNYIAILHRIVEKPALPVESFELQQRNAYPAIHIPDELYL